MFTLSGKPHLLTTVSLWSWSCTPTQIPIQRLKERTLMAALFVMLWQLNPTNLLTPSSSSGLTAVHVTNETVRRYQPEWN